ncbi:hypothetical protein [Microbacterium tumbae]
MTSVPAVAIDLGTVESRLTERGIAFRRVRVGDDAVVIVSSYGARVYGPFFGADASETWLPDAFHDPTDFAALHGSGAWNVGGDRIWVGPEIEYMIPDRDRYWDTYDMPASIDPATHVLSGAEDEPILHRQMRLRAHRRSRSEGRDVFTSLDLTVRIRATPNPLRHTATMPECVEYGGYATELTLSQAAGTPVDAESWMLVQVRPGGTALVPGASGTRVTDYYEPVGDLLERRPGGTAVTITGADRYKIGFTSAHVTGRLAYLRELGEDRAVIVVRASPVWAGLGYAEEPDIAPGHRGDALHIYNDDGGLGGFAELEARGTPISAVRSADGSAFPITDRFLTWWFRGSVSAVHDVARQLAHVEPAPQVHA